MTTRPLVDPELQPLLDVLPAFDFSLESLPAIREQFKAMALAAPCTIEATVTERHIPGPAGAPAVRVLIYTPPAAEASGGALLHMHGGGYVVGLPELDDGRNRALCRELGLVVVSVDYRLAPEAAFPAPLEDCYAALKWLHDNAREFAVDPARIGIYGESAGGGLCAALALLARDRQEIPVAFQLLIYPMLDDRPTLTAGNPHTGEFVWTRPFNTFGWRCLLGGEPGQDTAPPYAVAARATSLAGLPPTFIGVGALDLFLEDNLAYATRLLQAGVATEAHVYPGAYHGFEYFLPEAAVSRRFERDLRDALRRSLA